MNFWRTALPMILLAALIFWNWPTEPVDFGSTSPWAGLVLEVDTSALENPPLLLIASLPAKDEHQKQCSLIVGTALWQREGKVPLLLDGETDLLRLQKLELDDETTVLYRKTRGFIGAYPISSDDNVDKMIGGILYGDKIIPAWSSNSDQPVVLQIPGALHVVDFEILHDDQNKKRWRSNRSDFRQLWDQAESENPELLKPFLHGEVAIGSNS
ncbi:MAG: hypothetical protein VX764_08425 [Planctomycetota bacterium]|nr:hypothetical protein [Planctomycetota bacterium]